MDLSLGLFGMLEGTPGMGGWDSGFELFPPKVKVRPAPRSEKERESGFLPANMLSKGSFSDEEGRVDEELKRAEEDELS